MVKILSDFVVTTLNIDSFGLYEGRFDCRGGSPVKLLKRVDSKKKRKYVNLSDRRLSGDSGSRFYD